MEALLWIVASGCAMAAIAMNVLSAATFLAGGLVAWAVSAHLDVRFLVPLAGGNFLYIGASDLVPEVNKPSRLAASVLHLASFLAGIGVLLAIRLLVAEG